MQRTLVILLLAAALSACQSAPVRTAQATWRNMVHPCPESGYSSAIWSPDGSKIAYARLDKGFSSIFVMDLNTYNTIRLPNLSGSVYPHSWSPDGSRILLFDFKESGFRLVEADGSGQIDLPDFTTLPIIAWSPDGSRLAFSDSGALSILDIDTGLSTKIYSNRTVQSIAWSPSGERIAFIEGDLISNTYDLVLVNPDGTDPRKTKAPGVMRISPPVWSPDGEQIAYMGWDDSDVYLYVTDAEGANARKLDQTYGPMVWLPDSSALIAVYVLRGINLLSVRRLEMDGSAATLATLPIDSAPSFSPDASQIAYVSNEQGYVDLYVINIDGTNKNRLTHNPGYNTCFDWPF